MKVFVIGAHGRVGQLLVSQLHDRDDAVIAGIRDPSQQAAFSHNIVTVKLDLTDTTESIAAAMAGSDAVVFTAGAGGGYGETLQVDLDGAIKSMQACDIAGIKRYVMVSALYADERTGWTQRSLPYFIAKYYADDWLMHRTELAYTLIEPGVLTDDMPTNKITIAPTARGYVTRHDVATTIVTALHTPTTIGKTIGFNNGDVDIKQAIHSL